MSSSLGDKPQTVAPLTAEAVTAPPVPPVPPVAPAPPPIAEAVTTPPVPPVAPAPPPIAEPSPPKTVFNPLTSKYIDINLAPANVAAFADACELYNHAGQLLLNYDNDTCLTYLDNSSLLARIL